MKIPPNSPLHVSLEFAPDSAVKVGRLAFDRTRAVLEYDPSFVASGLRLNPELASARAGVLEVARNPSAFGGLHGVFADSLPGGWGEALLRRRASAHGLPYASLTQLDRLAIVGTRGMGALTYQPQIPSDDDGAERIDLDVLAHEAIELLEGRDSDVAAQLERLGGSSGGARPKVLVGMNASREMIAGSQSMPDGYEPWIIKFRGTRDVEDMGPLEAAYAAMARAAGLNISETRLIPSAAKPGYFATKRFDRAPGGVRRHMLSVAGMIDLPPDSPLMNYDRLLSLTRKVTAHEDAVERMVRRMAFNVIAHNRDDHTRQHAFLMDSSGAWTLAPPYDLTFSFGPNGEHDLTVGPRGTNISRDDVLTLAQCHIRKPHAIRIIDDVRTAVANFRAFASEFDASAASTQSVWKVLEAGLK